MSEPDWRDTALVSEMSELDDKDRSTLQADFVDLTRDIPGIPLAAFRVGKI